MISPVEIEKRIQSALPGARVQASDLTGGGDHYRVIVVAPQFENRGPVERHKMVYAPLKDVLGGELHALSLETKTPAEWEAANPGSTQDGANRLPRL